MGHRRFLLVTTGPLVGPTSVSIGTIDVAYFSVGAPNVSVHTLWQLDTKVGFRLFHLIPMDCEFMFSVMRFQMLDTSTLSQITC